VVEGKRVRDFGKGRKEGTMEASGRTEDEWMELWGATGRKAGG